ncbi:MAG: diheme cytochrome c [Nitrosomonadales bacterium]|nr:diheme cytochrome c [Nitrosomonadales bacterium]
MLVSALASVMISEAYAHDGVEHEGQKYQASNPRWKEDCGACHIAYPPQMLPAESWRAIMAGLDKHFGSDASLDADAAKEITEFLEKNAGTKKHEVLAKPLLRITEGRWFKSEHREVAARDWKNPKVKSPANCGACHTTADRGDFSEDNVKIPR